MYWKYPFLGSQNKIVFIWCNPQMIFFSLWDMSFQEKKKKICHFYFKNIAWWSYFLKHQLKNPYQRQYQSQSYNDMILCWMLTDLQLKIKLGVFFWLKESSHFPNFPHQVPWTLQLWTEQLPAKMNLLRWELLWFLKSFQRLE